MSFDFEGYTEDFWASDHDLFIDLKVMYSLCENLLICTCKTYASVKSLLKRKKMSIDKG